MSLGSHVLNDRYKIGIRLVGGSLVNSRGGLSTSFGHLGANGACAWTDPTEALAVGYIRNYGLRQRFPYLQTAQISDVALRCARARRS